MTESTYYARLDAMILEWRERSTSLSALLAATEGADPICLRDRMRVLGLAFPESPDENSLAGMHNGHESPELHPLDYEWYFTRECAEALARRFVGPRSSLLVIGAPTVAAAAAQLVPSASIVLVDRNPLLTRRFAAVGTTVRFVCADATERLDLRPGFDAVVFDAPWYMPSLERWIDQSAYLVRPSGMIVFPLFPPMLRPTALSERQRILTMLSGFGEFSVQRDILRYESPAFEVRALAPEGIKLPSQWRRCDLVSCTVRQPGVRPPAKSLSEDLLQTFVLGTQVIKLRQKVIRATNVSIEPVRNTFLYSQITTRDPDRGCIGLWTSRSRVAQVERPDVVAAMLQQLADGGILSDLAQCPELSCFPHDVRTRAVRNLAIVLGLDSH